MTARRSRSPLVENWFGDSFSQLHSKLRDLHTFGGELNGPVSIEIHPLLKPIIQSRLGIRQSDNHLCVSIQFDESGFYWSRSFNNATIVTSYFQPVGTIANGHWVERTGAISLRLGVEIIDGGWYWLPLDAKFHGITLPKFLVPRVEASKLIANESYEFNVSVGLPIIGQALRYKGRLSSNNSFKPSTLRGPA